jgi:hypothetical protein
MRSFQSVAVSIVFSALMAAGATCAGAEDAPLGGFVPACSPARSLPGRSMRSPSDQDVGNSPYRPLAVLSDVRVGSSTDLASRPN